MFALRETFKDVRFIAVIFSFIISLWCASTSIVNGDGVLYLESARLIAEGNWSLATVVYRWPFYSWLIATVSQLTTLSLESSAHVLDGGLIALVVYVYLNLLKEFSNDQKVVVAGAVVILIYPTLNEYRGSIFRDTGYLAFYLLSVWLFLRYLRNGAWADAVGWSASMAVATLFRIEGIIFLFLVPIILLAKTGTPVRQRLGDLLKTNVVLLVIILAAVMFWPLGSEFLSKDTSRLQEPVNYMQGLGSIASAIHDKANILKEHFLDRYAQDYALSIVWLSFLVILIASIIKTLTPVFSVLAVYSLNRGLLVFPNSYLKIYWYWLVFLNLAILAVFLVNKHFIEERFPLALSITVMLAVPFALVAAFESWRRKESRSWINKAAFPVLAVLMVGMAIDGLISFGPSRGYIKDAGLWIKNNTRPEATLYTNETTLLYYAGKVGSAELQSIRSGWKETPSFLSDKHRQRYDYLAIRIPRRSPEREALIIKTLAAEPIKTFVNNRGDKVLIFSEKK